MVQSVQSSAKCCTEVQHGAKCAKWSKVCKMKQSVQNGAKFAKWCQVCKMVKGDRSWFSHHGLLQPKSAAKPSHLEKWLIKLSDSIMFNDLIVIYNCFYITLPPLSLALG